MVDSNSCCSLGHARDFAFLCEWSGPTTPYHFALDMNVYLDLASKWIYLILEFRGEALKFRKDCTCQKPPFPVWNISLLNTKAQSFQEITDVTNRNMTTKLTRTDSPNGICVLLHHVHRQYPVVELCIVAGNVAPQVGQEKGEIIPRPVPMCCRDTFWDWFPASLSFLFYSHSCLYFSVCGLKHLPCCLPKTSPEISTSLLLLWLILKCECGISAKLRPFMIRKSHSYHNLSESKIMKWRKKRWSEEFSSFTPHSYQAFPVRSLAISYCFWY